MRTHYYSAARAAMTGGDGMFSIGPPPTREGRNHPLMAQMADALGVTFEMIQAHWTATLLGYDPQKLLPPPEAYSFDDTLRRLLDYALEGVPRINDMWGRIYRGDELIPYETDQMVLVIDCGEIEAMMMHEGIATTTIRMGDYEKVTQKEVEALPPPDDYLRHDPTKNTRRRRRK